MLPASQHDLPGSEELHFLIQSVNRIENYWLGFYYAILRASASAALGHMSSYSNTSSSDRFRGLKLDRTPGESSPHQILKSRDVTSALHPTGGRELFLMEDRLAFIRFVHRSQVKGKKS